MLGIPQVPLDLRSEVAVVGLGHVGLTLFHSFLGAGHIVVGYDIDAIRIGELRIGRDCNNPHQKFTIDPERGRFTTEFSHLINACIYVIAVPTTIHPSSTPDLSALVRACENVGEILKRGDLVIIESTVYMGAIESLCLPTLVDHSGLNAPGEFGLAYCPERISPGEHEFTFAKIHKLISGLDANSLEQADRLYSSISGLNTVRCSSVRIAEASRLIENAQRDVNIAFMNEVAMLFHKQGIDTGEVLDVAATKWNFLKFEPGFVGGHCIGFQSEYLRHAARTSILTTPLLDAARTVNESVVSFVVNECTQFSTPHNRPTRVLILGLAYKENIPDLRNSGSIKLACALKDAGYQLQLHDPFLPPPLVIKELDMGVSDLSTVNKPDIIIVAVAHSYYAENGWDLIQKLFEFEPGTVFDIKRLLPREATPANIKLWRL